MNARSEWILFTLFGLSVLPLLILALRRRGLNLRKWTRARKRFAPQLFLDWIEDIIFFLERNGDLNHAIKSASEPGKGGASELISALNPRMRAGSLLDEALMSADPAMLNHIERSLLRVLLAASRGGRPELLRGLKMCRTSVRSNIWYLQKVAAATAQSVLQFWVLCALGPCLFAILVLMFPDLVFAAMSSVLGALSLGSSLLLYIMGVLVFRFLMQSGITPVSHRPAGPGSFVSLLEEWLPRDKPAWLWTLHEFVEVIRIELSSGSSPARAISVALEELQAQSCLVFDGAQELLRAHETLPLCLQRASHRTPERLRRVLSRVSLCCDEWESLNAYLESESEALREEFRSSLEASGGTLSVKLLIPLCLFLFPSILLLILGPVLSVMGPLFQ